MVVLRHELRRHSVVVEPDVQSAGAVGRAPDGIDKRVVVKERNVLPALPETRMVLPLESDRRVAADVLEVVTLPAEGPDRAAISSVDEDDVASCPTAYEVVAIILVVVRSLIRSSSYLRGKQEPKESTEAELTFSTLFMWKKSSTSGSGIRMKTLSSIP